MGDVTITRIGPDAAAQLALLWRETFQQAYQTTHSERDLEAYCDRHYTMEHARACLLDEKTICKFSMRGVDPRGYYIVRSDPCPIHLDGSSVELKQIYILASDYGAGLGHLLLGDAIRTVRELPAKYVWLTVSDRNTRAIGFYRKAGFVQRGAGALIEVGADRLTSSVLTREV